MVYNHNQESHFGKDYFTSINYSNYLDRTGKYRKLVSELLPELCQHTNKCPQELSVLDFGCAVGHCCKALEENGVRSLIGYDISSWAVEYGRRTFELNYLTTSFDEAIKHSFDVCLMLDVLEHIDLAEVPQILEAIDSS